MGAKQHSCAKIWTRKYGKYKQAILRKTSTTNIDPGVRKVALHEANRKCVHQIRLKPLIDNVTSLCEEHYETQLVVLFFTLYSKLLAINESKKATAIFNI